MLPALDGSRPGTLLNTLQCTGRPHSRQLSSQTLSSAQAERPVEGRSSVFHLVSCDFNGCDFSERPLLLFSQSVLPLVGLGPAMFVPIFVFFGLGADLVGGRGLGSMDGLTVAESDGL